jgi:hypothetical protein
VPRTKHRGGARIAGNRQCNFSSVETVLYQLWGYEEGRTATSVDSVKNAITLYTPPGTRRRKLERIIVHSRDEAPGNGCQKVAKVLPKYTATNVFLLPISF